MGLISKYGKDLIGRIFLYHIDGRWCMGRITKVQTTASIYCDAHVIYKPLGQSDNLVAAPTSFWITSSMDDNSKLIEGAPQLSKYLELFSGTNR